jgi:hypothetical protein
VFFERRERLGQFSRDARMLFVYSGGDFRRDAECDLF